jgi:hypothetical protein
MEKLIEKIGTDRLVIHPNHVDEISLTYKEILEGSLKRTSKQPGNLIIAVPILDSQIPGYYWVVEGRTALGLMIHKGYFEVEALVYQITDESQIMNLISELEEQNGQIEGEI